MKSPAPNASETGNERAAFRPRRVWECFGLASLFASLCVVCAHPFLAAGETPFTIPTFHCAGLYWSPPGGAAGKEVLVRYRRSGETGWKQELPMRYNPIPKDTLLSQVLSPEEKFEYDTRLSYTAVSLQNRLGDFAPSEQEFRDLVRLQKQYDDNYGPLSLAASGRDVSQERAVAQKELEAQTRALLGDERYLEYRHEQTWARSSFRNVAQEHGIPKQTAFQVFDITDVAGQQADAIRGNAMLSRNQKQTALDAIRGQTESTLAGMIGQPALQGA